jgi:hypothetical protein
MTDDILEIHVSRNSADERFPHRSYFPGCVPIVVRARDDDIRFACYLSRVERIYLRELLIRVLVERRERKD